VAPGKPLKLADFPATKDGDLARKICQAWAGLRGQYYSRMKSDTRSQLSQWFSGPDWTAVHADSLRLTADRAYVHLGASLGVAMAGSAVSAKTRRSTGPARQATRPLRPRQQQRPRPLPGTSPEARPATVAMSQRAGSNRLNAPLRRFPPPRRHCPPATSRDTRDTRGTTPSLRHSRTLCGPGSRRLAPDG
jgi:hypothetical protein